MENEFIRTITHKSISSGRPWLPVGGRWNEILCSWVIDMWTPLWWSPHVSHSNAGTELQRILFPVERP
jgi:hypothetical protein